MFEIMELSLGVDLGGDLNYPALAHGLRNNVKVLHSSPLPNRYLLLQVTVVVKQQDRAYSEEYSDDDSGDAESN